MDDLVRGGFAQAGPALTDTGYKSYGLGRLFLPAAHGSNDVGISSTLTIPVPVTGTGVTMGCRVAPCTRVTTDSIHTILSTPSSGPRIAKTTTNKFAAQMGHVDKNYWRRWHSPLYRPTTWSVASRTRCAT